MLDKTGAGEWNRTTDLRFTKPLLCQLSYAGFPGGNTSNADRKRDLTQDVKHLSMQRCDRCKIPFDQHATTVNLHAITWPPS